MFFFIPHSETKFALLVSELIGADARNFFTETVFLTKVSFYGVVVFLGQSWREIAHF